MSAGKVMSDNTLKPDELEAFVIRRKQAWRELAHAMSWEEKVAAIERMWERDKSLKIAREKIKQAANASA